MSQVESRPSYLLYGLIVVMIIGDVYLYHIYQLKIQQVKEVADALGARTSTVTALLTRIYDAASNLRNLEEEKSKIIRLTDITNEMKVSAVNEAAAIAAIDTKIKLIREKIKKQQDAMAILADTLEKQTIKLQDSIETATTIESNSAVLRIAISKSSEAISTANDYLLTQYAGPNTDVVMALVHMRTKLLESIATNRGPLCLVLTEFKDDIIELFGTMVPSIGPDDTSINTTTICNPEVILKLFDRLMPLIFFAERCRDAKDSSISITYTGKMGPFPKRWGDLPHFSDVLPADGDCQKREDPNSPYWAIYNSIRVDFNALLIAYMKHTCASGTYSNDVAAQLLEKILSLACEDKPSELLLSKVFDSITGPLVRLLRTEPSMPTKIYDSIITPSVISLEK